MSYPCLSRRLHLHLLLVGLQVDPLPLRSVQVVQDLVQVAELVLPHAGPVPEGVVVGRALDGLEEDLVVPDLVEDVLPVLDEGHVLPGGGDVVGEGELGLDLPDVELAEGLADDDLADGAVVELLELVLLGGEAVLDLEEVVEDELVHRLLGHAQDLVHLRPVLVREDLAADVLQDW